MARARYLTKSRYTLALECPTKLYYADHPETYDNKNLDDPFLRALAHGGFQVGALAKVYFPSGVEVATHDHAAAVEETKALLERDEVVIFEAAFQHGDLFIRADVVVKQGQRVDIVEVKAKSFDPKSDAFLDQRLAKKGITKITEKWRRYLYDVAFQTYVAKRARPDLEFTPHLMLVDKSSVSTVEALNQRFLLLDEDGLTTVRVASGTSLESVGQQILRKIDVSREVDLIHLGKDLGERTRSDLGVQSFEDEVATLASAFVAGRRIDPILTANCKHCEFRTVGGKKSGFVECWAGRLGSNEVTSPLVFDIWNFRKADVLLESGKVLLQDVTEADISPKAGSGKGLTASERQWVQVRLTRENSKAPYVDIDGLRAEMATWHFPLHFIDFETAMVAIPFNVGKRPYEQIAFQFSHHTVTEDGRIEHAGQYTCERRGVFPNFDFVRALKRELDGDSGTIFRYAAHENTVLCKIYEQLAASDEADRQELMVWIKSITTSSSSMDEEWTGQRSMVDMLEVLKRYYYHPLMNGSNSLKKVLPAILYESSHLRTKYETPVYGSPSGIPSLNFKDWAWLQTDPSGAIIDPYKRLPPIFDGIDLDKLEFTLMGDDELADGGAAMTAYAKMQFTEMSEAERAALRAALLKYCELDTLAMVMLFEHWAELTKAARLRGAA